MLKRCADFLRRAGYTHVEGMLIDTWTKTWDDGYSIFRLNKKSKTNTITIENNGKMVKLAGKSAEALYKRFMGYVYVG